MGAGVNRVATVAMVSVVLLGTSALGYGVARSTADSREENQAAPRNEPRRQTAAPTTPSRDANQAANRTGNRAVRKCRCGAR